MCPSAQAQSDPCFDPEDRIAPFCPVSERLFAAGGGAKAVAAADIDQDGDQDVITLNSVTVGTAPRTQVQVYLNTCVADFFEPVRTVNLDISASDTVSPVDFVVVPLNPDSYPDVAVLCEGGLGDQTDYLIILISDGSGGFDTPSYLALGSSEDVRAIDAGDFDMDGDIDVVVLSRSGEATRLWIAWNRLDEQPPGFDASLHMVENVSKPNSLLVCDFDLDECNTNGTSYTRGPDITIGTEGAFVHTFFNLGCLPGESPDERFNFAADENSPLEEYHVVQVPGSGFELYLQCGRFNDDAGATEYPDLVVARRDEVTVLFNQRPVNWPDTFELAAGTSTASEDYGNVYFLTGILAADLDADGFDDLMTMSTPGAFASEARTVVFHNLTQTDPQGAWGGFDWTPFILSRTPIDIAAADLNGDGCVDALTHDGLIGIQGRGRFSILLGTCDARLRVQAHVGSLDSQEPTLDKLGVDVDCGDFNADGLPDILVTNLHKENLWILTQRPDGAFATGALAGHCPDPPDDCSAPPHWDDNAIAGAAANFNGVDSDGRARDDVAMIFDLAGSEPQNVTNVRVLLSEPVDVPPGTTTDVLLSLSLDLTIGTAIDLSDIAAADVDNANGPDLVITDSRFDGMIWVVYNDGAGTFLHPQTGLPNVAGFMLAGSTAAVRNPKALVVADFNGDEYSDIATANEDGNAVSVMLNDGSGVFPLALGTSYPVGLEPLDIAVGLVNNDSHIDLVVANRLSNSVTILLNNTFGEFTSILVVTVGNEPVAVALADMNSDGVNDIVTLDSFHQTLSSLLNYGNGQFEEEHRIILPAGSGAEAMSICDINRDCKPDIINTRRAQGFDNGNVLRTIVRVSYNECFPHGACTRPGDFNDDGLVDGDDIQDFICTYYLFVDTYFDAHAYIPLDWCSDRVYLPHHFCAADLTQDGYLDYTDLECFVDTLLGQPCPGAGGPCDEHGGSLSPGESDESPQNEEATSPQSESATQASGSSWQPDPDFIPKLECYLDWWRENMPRDYPELSELEYRELCIDVMLDCGLDIPAAWRPMP